jgi:glycosyltransferase involved in cell wall biosynthesis
VRVLAITQIWPNGKEPLSSPFNVQQFRELAKRCELRVLAALAYFPLAKVTKQPPRPALLADLPACETIAGIETTYMRQLYVPAIGVPVAVPLYVASLAPHRELLKWADVILGTWAYPDGCASVIAARALGKPCVVKVHGTDINVIAKRFTPRRVLSRVLPKADAMVTVSNPLGEEIAALGVPRSKIFLVANGVDTEVFAPRERDAAREELGVPKGRPLVVFVGRLEPQKGLVELLAAFDRVRALRPDAMLALVGDGVSRAQADEAAKRHDGALRVVGARPLREVARWLTACDVFTLPSHLEGTPNVVLEALASGRPAVATRVGGIPDVLGSPDAGILVEPRDADDLARGLLDALGRTWDPERVRAAGPGSWRQSAERLYDVLVRARGGGA